MVVKWAATLAVFLSLIVMMYREPPCSAPPWDATRDTYTFSLVSDLDKQSRNTTHFEWHAIFKTGTIHRLPSGNYSLSWNNTVTLSSQFAKANRSMELSELLWFNNNLYTMCDISGITGEIFPRWILSDGSGKEAKPMKIEWATVKDDKMYIGSVGKEWVDLEGAVLHRNMEWIKTIDKNGMVKNINWASQYTSIRNFLNASYPHGYVWHEAVVWNPNICKWVFLPRKHSVDHPYDPETDELLGTNIMVLVEDNFGTETTELELIRVGPLEPAWGYTSVKVIPDSNDLMALKVMEVGGETKTKIHVFDLNGNFLMEPFMLVDEAKYEGLEIFAN